MPFQKKCGSASHEAVMNSALNANGNLIKIGTSKKLKGHIIEKMVGKNLINDRCLYLREQCYANECELESKAEPPVTNEVTKEAPATKEVPVEIPISNEIAHVINKIKSGEILENEFLKLVECVGVKIKDNVKNTAANNSKKDLENLNFSKELCAIESSLVTFLKAMSTNNNNEHCVLNAAEHLINLTNKNYIGKLNFSLSLMTHFMTGSRSAVELRGKYSPSGSYTSLMKYINENSINPVLYPAGSDILVYFDNNQVLARNWNVKFDCKSLISVSTTVLCLIPPSFTNFQYEPCLSPLNWLTYVDCAGIEPVSEPLKIVFRTKRNSAITKIIKLLQKEAMECDGIIPCKRKKVIIDNDINITYDKLHVDPYDDIDSTIDGQTKCIILDPLMVNPCSYESVSSVFDSILLNCYREWVIVGCDGLPYVLGARVIDNYYTCPHCNKLFKKTEEFSEHDHVKNYNINIKACKKYGKILLVPGLGHFEINYTKALFKLLWPVVLIDIAKMLGFKSVKALAYCETASDHHKSWQILNIFYDATSRELLQIFLDHCNETKEEPTITYLYKWIESIQNKNYTFIFKAVFSYIFGIKLFRKGVRRGNHNIIQSSMQKLSTLFYGLNMTTYMEIDLKYKLTITKAPEEIKQLLLNTQSLSQSGHESKGEGGDFILETKNKNIKMWMPPGVPTEQRWTRICRNLPTMDKIKSNLQNVRSADEESENVTCGFRKSDFPEEIRQWRNALRTSKYLEKVGDHVSFQNKPLDVELVNFDRKCANNQTTYYRLYPDHCKCERIFFTPDDRAAYNDIKNKTKAEISIIIENSLQAIEDAGAEDEYNTCLNIWKKTKTGTKTVMLTFYKELSQTLEEVQTKDLTSDH